MRHWAISVGINQYQFFQPLSHAQHDAQALQAFWVNDVGMAADECVLLTETSPPQEGISTYPNRENIQGWLDRLTQRVEPGDTLWCFFSGYGVCQQGRDYLVPIEGNPGAIAATALPIEAIFNSLKRVKKATVLVLLDINRNDSSFSYETVGTQTAQLASQAGIPTLLSCQPGQFSRETSALGHGFFTAALLEGLQNHHGATLAELYAYLSDRLPALSELYWRPIQQPVLISAAETLHQPLLPSSLAADSQSSRDRAVVSGIGQRSASTNGVALKTPSTTDAGAPLPYGGYGNGSGRSAIADMARTAIANGGSVKTNGSAIAQTTGATNPSASPFYGTSTGLTKGARNGANGATNGSVMTQAQVNGVGTEPPLDSATQNHENGSAQSAQAPVVTQPNSDPSHDADEISDALFWRPVLRWGGFAVVALILGVLLRNHAAFDPKPQSVTQQPNPPASLAPAAKPAPAASSPASVSHVIDPSAATAVPPSRLSIAAAQVGVSGTSRLNPQLAGSKVAQNQTTAAVTNKPGTAAQTLPVRSIGTVTLAPSPATGSLAKARAVVVGEPNQASPYWYAIQAAKKIQPGQPDYAQSQQEIAGWSRQIMAIARQRGRQQRFDAAIVAAKLVPQDQPTYTDVKNAFGRWCPLLQQQRGVNPLQRQQARDTCQRSLG